MQDKEERIKKVNEIIENIKRELDTLKQLLDENKKDEISYVFDKLKDEVVHDKVNTILFIEGNDVKYFSRVPEPVTNIPVIIIRSNKAYLMDNYSIQEKKKIIIRYTVKYSIPDDIINILRRLPESDIDYAEPSVFQFYYLLKKYPINHVNFVKIQII